MSNRQPSIVKGIASALITLILLWMTELLGKKKRCGQCPGCKAPDCQTCKYCLDMPKYGGPRKLRRPCAKRICDSMVNISL